MKVEKESEKAGLQLNIQKAKIMASGPITSWQVDGETVERMADFIFLGSKITDGDCENWVLHCQKWFSHRLNNPRYGICYKAVRKNCFQSDR